MVYRTTRLTDIVGIRTTLFGHGVAPDCPTPPPAHHHPLAELGLELKSIILTQSGRRRVLLVDCSELYEALRRVTNDMQCDLLPTQYGRLRTAILSESRQLESG